MSAKTLTSKEAAELLGVTVATFRKKAAAAGLVAADVVKSGGRGRPAFAWLASAVKGLK